MTSSLTLYYTDTQSKDMQTDIHYTVLTGKYRESSEWKLERENWGHGKNPYAYSTATQ